MKSTLLIALSFLAAPLAAVTFGKTPIVVGSAWTDQGQYGPAGKQESLVERTKRITVTAMEGEDVAAFNVEYTAVKMNGRDATPTFAGKLYTVTVTGNHVIRVTKAGVDAPRSESGFVTSDNSDIAQFVELTRTFAGQDVAAGATLAAKTINNLYDVRSGFTVDRFSMTLKSVSGRTATFDVTLQVSGGTSITMALSGRLHADVAGGRILDLSLKGPLTAGDQKTTTTLVKKLTY